jgi:hypothetical protein
LWPSDYDEGKEIKGSLGNSLGKFVKLLLRNLNANAKAWGLIVLNTSTFFSKIVGFDPDNRLRDPCLPQGLLDNVTIRGQCYETFYSRKL